MKTKTLAFLSAALLAFSFASAPTAQTLSGTFSLSGGEEVPPNASAATGTATVTLDLGTNLLTWNISHAGLAGGISGAHFHGPAAVGVNAGIQLALSTATNPIAGSATVSASQATDIANGLWYANLHSGGVPGGEIRGQVALSAAAVPVGEGWHVVALVVLLAGAGLFALRR